MKLFVFVLGVLFIEVKSQVPHEVYGVPNLQDANQFPIVVPEPTTPKAALLDYELPKEPAPVILTNYAYTIPVEEPKPQTVYGTPAEVPMVDVKTIKPDSEILDLSKPAEIYGLPFEPVQSVQPAPVVVTNYAYTIPAEEPKPVPAAPSEVYGPPAAVTVPEVQEFVPIGPYELPLPTKYAYTIPEAPKVIPTEAPRPVVPAEVYGVPVVKAAEPVATIPNLPAEGYGVPQEPQPVVVTKYAYTIPVEEPKPVVTEAPRPVIPAEVYGVPYVKAVEPEITIPNVPAEVYGVPQEPKPVVVTKYAYTIPVEEPKPVVTEAPRPVVPAEVYGVPYVKAAEPEVTIPNVPAEVYGVPQEPKPVVVTKYAYTIPVEEPKPVVTEAPRPVVPAEVYGVPAVKAAETEIPSTGLPAETYGLPQEPQPVVVTNYQYTIPETLPKAVVSEGPYPAPVEVPITTTTVRVPVPHLVYGVPNLE